MREKNLQRLMLVGVVFSLLAMQIPALVSSQDPEGKAVSESDTEMIGVSEYNGGGHMTVRITGEQAVVLRNRIIYMFDEHSSPPRIPAGFTGQNWDTDGDGDGILDAAEVIRYSLWVQYHQWEGGVPYLFGEMTKAEILEGETAGTVELSISGLVGTDVNSTDAVEFKHLFNIRSGAQERNYLLADNLTISGLYEGFSLQLANDFPDQLTFAPFSGIGEPGTQPWILRSHDATDPNDYALWHGPEDTPNYENRLIATTYADFDLRFAVEAAMRFNYKGFVEAGDVLTVQIREEGGSYTNLGTLTSSDNTATFDTLVFDLDDYVGKKVRLSLNFTSNQSLNNTGFFIDDFSLNAPCYYHGEVELHHTDFLVGVLSFSNFYPDEGSSHLIRTPAGMILMYSSSFDTDDPSNDRAVFRSFDFLDNPQVLFVLMFICAYLISHFQNKYYNGYRRMYAAMHRQGWYKRKWVHWIGVLCIILFIVFYFFPTLFVFAGLNFYLIGVAMWLIYIVIAVVVVVGTKVVYHRAELAIPPSEPEEDEIQITVEAPAEDYEPIPGGEIILAVPCSVCLEDLFDVATEGIKCRCGQVFHKDCAAKAERCPNCNRLLEAVKPKEKRMLTVKCPACGDIVLVDGDADLLRTNCESCGSILQEVARGYNYLIVDDSPSVAYEE
ncbi:MAG: immune inhibitor A, partial [Thermoplasmata archaeon]|nr:immune inhibitor A [Thermoplasmata archaeon]